MSSLVLKVNHVSSVEKIWRSLRVITNIHINSDPCIHEEVREKLLVPSGLKDKFIFHVIHCADIISNDTRKCSVSSKKKNFYLLC